MQHLFSSKSLRLFARSALSLALLLLTSQSGFAADTTRNTATGTWTDGNWSAGTPGVSDHAIIGGVTGDFVFADAAVTLDGGTTTVQALSLGLTDNTTFSSGTLNLSSGATLNVLNDFHVGHGQVLKGSGIVNMESGTSIDVGNDLYMANSAWTIDGDEVAVGRDVYLGAPGYSCGAATLTQDGGTFNVDGSVYVGRAYPGTLNLTNGAVLRITNDLALSYSYTQPHAYEINMGTNTHIIIGRNLEVRARTFTWTPDLQSISIGEALKLGAYRVGHVYLVQNGGRIVLDRFELGYSSLASGTHYMNDGATVSVRRPTSGSVDCAVRAANGHQRGLGAMLYLGDADSPGLIDIDDSGGGSGTVNLKLRAVFASAGAHTNWIRGWGSIDLDGILSVNGQVIADGYGQERDLAMTNFSQVVQPAEPQNDVYLASWRQPDGQAPGWYAENMGRLLLPPLTNISGTVMTRWGDSPDDLDPITATQDLANSMVIAFSNVTGGDLGISLISTGRTEVPTTSTNILGIWTFDTTAGTGFSFGGGSARITFIYDGWAAAARNIDESELKLWRYTSYWRELGSDLDPTNKTLTTSPNVNAFGSIAVSLDAPGPIPPAGSVISIM